MAPGVQASPVTRHMMLPERRVCHIKCFATGSSNCFPSESSAFSFVVVMASFEGVFCSIRVSKSSGFVRVLLIELKFHPQETSSSPMRLYQTPTAAALRGDLKNLNMSSNNHAETNNYNDSSNRSNSDKYSKKNSSINMCFLCFHVRTRSSVASGGVRCVESVLAVGGMIVAATWRGDLVDASCGSVLVAAAHGGLRITALSAGSGG
jgi:hypothetical protein